MKLVTLSASASDVHGFVRFWSRIYHDPREHLYEQNIGFPQGSEQLQALYTWKNGGRLSKAKQRSLEANFGHDLALPKTGEMDDLRTFICDKGGPIWRIFYLHCRAPQTYPIFDQHVHRAMRWIATGMASEIPAKLGEVAHWTAAHRSSCAIHPRVFRLGIGQGDGY